MMRLTVLLVFCLVHQSIASGGGGHGSSAGEKVSSDNDGVKIIAPPGKLKLTCDVTNEDESFKSHDWYKDGTLLSSTKEEDRLVLKEDGTLFIEKTTEEDLGNYVCKAGSEELRAVKVVEFSFKKLPKSGTAIEGDKLTLTCEATGIPRPIVTWLKDNTSIVEALGAERVEFRTNGDDEKTPFNSTVVVSDIVKDDRGNFSCIITTATNDYEYSTHSYIRVKDIYAALWPFLGIVAEVVVLCLIIFIYERRRTKNDFDESDTDQGTNVKGHN